MTNRKSTKRALLGSIMAMVLCLAMLVGATFAWFTDTASTGVNKIQAGNLTSRFRMRLARRSTLWHGQRKTVPLSPKMEKRPCGSRAAPTP